MLRLLPGHFSSGAAQNVAKVLHLYIIIIFMAVTSSIIIPQPSRNAWALKEIVYRIRARPFLPNHRLGRKGHQEKMEGRKRSGYARLPAYLATSIGNRPTRRSLLHWAGTRRPCKRAWNSRSSCHRIRTALAHHWPRNCCQEARSHWVRRQCLRKRRTGCSSWLFNSTKSK